MMKKRKFYYLMSRYYDTNTYRFINSDSHISSSDELFGSNMYAYCENNPVSRLDANGDFWLTAIIDGSLIGGFIGGLGYIADCKVNNQNIDPFLVVMNTAIGGLSGAIGGSGADKGNVLTNAKNNFKNAKNSVKNRKNIKYAMKIKLESKKTSLRRLFQ